MRASAKAANTAIMIAAALVMRPAVFSSPSSTAHVLSRVRAHASFMRASMRTS